jgi:hypothetical protein
MNSAPFSRVQSLRLPKKQAKPTATYARSTHCEAVADYLKQVLTN